MVEMNETHPFQVSIWIPGNSNPKSILEKGHWMEEARCRSKYRAEEVALCLSLRHSQGVQITELACDEQGSSWWQEYKYLPASACTLGKQSEPLKIEEAKDLCR